MLELLERRLFLGRDIRTEGMTALMKMYIRLPVERNLRTHSRLTALCSMFLQLI